MALDLSDLIETLKREVNPPGQSVLTAGDDEWLGRLMDAFWDGRIDGLFAGYVVDDDGLVQTVPPGGDDMPRETGQAIVFLAAYNALYQQFMQLRTQFRAQSGDNVFEYQLSAQVLKELAASLKERRNILLYRLSDIGQADTYVIDAFLGRQEALEAGSGYVITGGYGPPLNLGQTQSRSW